MDNVAVGSICGGGRYDDLTGIFGLQGMSGVGISFGADRIYDVMEELKLFPEAAVRSTQVLFVNFGDAEASFCMQQLKRLRMEGLRAEIYPDATKMKKQMKYADDRRIPFVVLAGSQEIAQQRVTVKDMKSGEQEEVAVLKLVEHLSSRV